MSHRSSTARARGPLLFVSCLLAGALGCSSADPSSTDSPTNTVLGGKHTDAGTAPVGTAHGKDSGAPPTTTNPPGDDDASSSEPDASTTPPTLAGWTLTWNDEFNAADGTAIDSSKWNQETGNSGWGYNKERQFYTGGTDNSSIQGGSLVITAKTQGASAHQCQYGTCQYTSGRFNTQGKFEQLYGRFEARIQIPRGQGMWPAWWMLGNNIGDTGWPTCGEIDIMENVGSDPTSDHGSMHGPGYSGGNPLTASYSMPNGGQLADAYHVYAVEWEPNVARFYFDDTLYETRTPDDVPNGSVWVYDHPFYLILNLAVGGQWPGDPDSTTQFPQAMKVDYVRVYKKS